MKISLDELPVTFGYLRHDLWQRRALPAALRGDDWPNDVFADELSAVRSRLNVLLAEVLDAGGYKYK